MSANQIGNIEAGTIRTTDPALSMQILPFADRQAMKAYRPFERGICHALAPA
jgi:hypothetical protein